MAPKKTSLLERGFKSRAEKSAKEYRELLKIHPCGRLDAFKLAKHIRIPVYTATELFNSSEYDSLLAGEHGHNCDWSALTMDTQIGHTIIIYNPFHSEARQQSDIMHEIAHLICKHKYLHKDYGFEIPFGMRYYDEVQEEEAKYMGSILQLATPCLLWARRQNMSREDISSYFTASIDMVNFRLNMTGLSKDFK